MKHKLKKALHERLVGQGRIDKEEFRTLVRGIATQTAERHSHDILRANHSYLQFQLNKSLEGDADEIDGNMLLPVIGGNESEITLPERPALSGGQATAAGQKENILAANEVCSLTNRPALLKQDKQKQSAVVKAGFDFVTNDNT